MRRRRVLMALVLAPAIFAGCGGCGYLYRRVGGDFTLRPAQWRSELSPAARALIDQAYAHLDPARLRDYHVHVVGLGSDGNGLYVHPKMRSLWHPVNRIKFQVYFSAVKVRHLERADRELVLRLVDLARNLPQPTRLQVMAFDRHYRQDGTDDEALTEFHVPNDYVLALAREFPDVFAPTVSVHPYRPGALEELERCAAAGARYVKWLPNAMGMDPADPAIAPYYQRLKALGLILISHTGGEAAVDAEAYQALGNPLRLRAPLDAGVKVIAAHCASLGDDQDLDDPARPRVPSFDLFLRLMDEPRYRGRLLGELSAMTQFNRLDRPLRLLLERDDLEGRIVNGSDYPLPAINFLIRTGELAQLGWITAAEREALNEIYGCNPLLFDLVLKRTLHHPQTGRKLPDSWFTVPETLEAR